MQRSDGKQQKMFYTEAIGDNDILLCFASDEEILSRRQIAERLWRKVTPGLCFRIERLVAEGHLEKRIDKLSNGMAMFWYRKAL